MHGMHIRLVDIDYTSKFTCSVCKDIPDVVIFDGITLGTVKNLPPPVIEIDPDQRISLVPKTMCLFIPPKAQRNALSEYLHNGLSIVAFQEMVQSIGPNPLTDYI